MKYIIFAYDSNRTRNIRKLFDEYGHKNILCGNKIFRGIVENRYLYHLLHSADRASSSGSCRFCALEAESKEGISSMTLFKLAHSEDILMQTKPIELNDFVDCVYEANKYFQNNYSGLVNERSVAIDALKKLPLI